MALTNILIEYMEDLHFFGPPYKVMEWYRENAREVARDGTRTGRFTIKVPTREEKLNILLKDIIPLCYDVFLVKDKLLGLCPYLPGMYDIIGKPKLYLVHKEDRRRWTVNYCFEDFVPPARDKYKPIYRFGFSYLIIEDLPQQLLQIPSDWELHFEFKDFSKKVDIQKNPFAISEPKFTLLCIQKNQPLDALANWCDHYSSNHEVGRIIIYNNDLTDPQNLPDIPINNKVELWYLDWNFSFQLRFLSCQAAIYNHANWWLKDAAPYIFNFDPDEYLVNESGMSLPDYLKQKAIRGIRVKGYEVPQNIPLPLTHDKEISKLGTPDHKNCTKYVFSSNYWYSLFTHSARRYTFSIINPVYWNILQYSSKNFRVFIARYFYKVFFLLSRIFSGLLRMKRPPFKEIYYLHYRSINTYWIYSKETLSNSKK